MVLFCEPLYQINLLEGELYGVAVLRVAWHVRGPELATEDHSDIQLIKYHARLEQRLGRIWNPTDSAIQWTDKDSIMESVMPMAYVRPRAVNSLPPHIVLCTLHKHINLVELCDEVETISSLSFLFLFIVPCPWYNYCCFHYDSIAVSFALNNKLCYLYIHINRRWFAKCT